MVHVVIDRYFPSFLKGLKTFLNLGLSLIVHLMSTLNTQNIIQLESVYSTDAISADKNPTIQDV